MAVHILANKVVRAVADDYRDNLEVVNRMFEDGCRVFLLNYSDVDAIWDRYISSDRNVGTDRRRALLQIKSGTWEGLQPMIERINAMGHECEVETEKAKIEGNVLVVAVTDLSDESANIRAVAHLQHKLPGVFVIDASLRPDREHS